MMAGKVVGLGFEIISKLDSYFLMTVRKFSKTKKLILYDSQCDETLKCDIQTNKRTDQRKNI